MSYVEADVDNVVAFPRPPRLRRADHGAGLGEGRQGPALQQQAGQHGHREEEQDGRQQPAAARPAAPAAVVPVLNTRLPLLPAEWESPVATVRDPLSPLRAVPLLSTTAPDPPTLPDDPEQIGRAPCRERG